MLHVYWPRSSAATCAGIFVVVGFGYGRAHGVLSVEERTFAVLLRLSHQKIDRIEQLVVAPGSLLVRRVAVPRNRFEVSQTLLCPQLNIDLLV